MFSDPINEEIRAIKRKLSAEFDYDVGKILADVRRQEEEGRKQGRKYVTLPSKRITPIGERLPTCEAPAVTTPSAVLLPVSPLPISQVPTDYAGS